MANAGSLGFVVAYLCVALSFLKLRTSESEMARPYKVPMGKPFGIVGLVGTIGMLTLYLPGSSGALAWPYEWIIVLAWFCFGSVAYLLASRRPAFVNS